MWKLPLFLAVFAACSPKDSASPTLPAPPPKPGFVKPAACADDEGCHALWYDVHGKEGNPPHPNDLRAINRAAGDVVASGKATSFTVLKTYPAGGYVACLETLADGGYAAIVDAFATFRVGDQTYFEPILVKACPAPN